jgi:hypothetical protein
MKIPCVRCKGRDSKRFCGRDFCPIYTKAEYMFKVDNKLTKEDFFGSSPAPFVGRFEYPNVNVGILSPPEQVENSWEYDAPRYWATQNFQIPKIVDFRSSLVNSRFKAEVKSVNKFLEISQEIGMASKPVDVEINLKQKPKFRLNVRPEIAPMGPNAKLKDVQITSNPKISPKVERVVDDTDLKAKEALLYLYGKGFDENFLSKILSVGNLGLKKDRKLVPTRWSITATDDQLGRSIIDEIKQYKEFDYSLYYGYYLGNYYFVLMFPEVWSYELFEAYMPRASFNVGEGVQYTTDYEPYTGRKRYAENCAGGYYAARLPVLEKLKKLKRQASVLVFRFITGEYAVPLGVWVCREAARKAMMSRTIQFEDQELMLEYVKEFVKKKFGYDLENLLKESLLLRNLRSQVKLKRFI